MRTSIARIAGLLSLALFTSCTVKSVEAPPLAGPSTFAKDLNLKVSRDILTQNGSDFADVTVEAKDPNSKPVSGLSLRAQIQISGTAQDFGNLNTKNSVTGSTGQAVFRYTVPAAPPVGTVGQSQTVTVAVTPEGTDFGGEFTRFVDIRVLPQGVIGNPTISPSFIVTPASPVAFDNATLDASATTNQGVACGNACSYSWDFGDGTTGSGRVTTHQFRSGGVKVVVLTVTDAAGFRASTLQNVTVLPPVPPTVSFVVSPTGGYTIGTDVFFNASASKPAAGRTLVSYNWSFGDGTEGGGVTTSHRFSATGSYNVVLTGTDDAGATAQATTTIAVVAGNPTVALTILPASPRVNQTVFFDASTSTAVAGSTISTYTWLWGDNGTPETTAGPQQTHVYASAGTYVVTLTVTDNAGRTATKQTSVVVTP